MAITLKEEYAGLCKRHKEVKRTYREYSKAIGFEDWKQKRDNYEKARREYLKFTQKCFEERQAENGYKTKAV